MGVTILTDIPSPYQVELFDQLDRRCDYPIHVIYLRRSHKSRHWALANIRHSHCIVESGQAEQAREWVWDDDLVVFCEYRQKVVRGLIRTRQISGMPWAFWGERPGFRLRGWLGRRYRRWAQAEIRRSPVPIWGVGVWAVDGYRSEVGDERAYISMPYYSDLRPFLNIARPSRREGRARFLFSGRLIRRKGVDLLVAAILRLLKDGIPAELHVLGEGPLEKELIRSVAGFSDMVRFHGAQEWNRLADVYAQADFLCAPSRYDGWGLVVPEGLAAGMPVISTDRTGAARELVNDTNGWLVPAGDGRALYRAVRCAATLDQEKWREMSTNARRIAARQHLDAGAMQFKRAVEVSLEAWTRARAIQAVGRIE